MKWAKRITEVDTDIPQDQRANHFSEYDDIIISDFIPPRQKAEAMKAGAVVKTLFEWVRFDPLPIRIRSKKAQRKYEIWVGSYLNFRPPPSIDYEVFFQWQIKPGRPGESLIIFLYPDPLPPPPLVADPPSPPAPPPPETSA